MRFHIVVAAYAIWLVAVFGVFYLAHGADGNALQLTVICGLIPAGSQICLLGVDWRGLVAPARLWFALLFVILLSYLVNALNPATAPTPSVFPDDAIISGAWTPIVYTVNVVFILVIASLVAACPDRRLLRSVAGVYSILGAIFLIYVDATGERVWGRLRANNIEPNVWGLFALSVCLGALARKFGVIALAALAAGATTIFIASSREHILALLAALLVIAVLYSREMNHSRVFGVLAGTCVALILGALLLDPYILNAIGYVKADVLLLGSPTRGLDSGFTGRTEIWTATIDLWLKHPFLGIGFRQHEQFLAGAPAHNAYLAMLADTGVLGLIVYLVLLITSLAASWGIEDPRTRRFIMAVIVTYIVIGFFDRRTINAGNPFGLFFLMCCAVALTDQSRRKAAALAGKLAWHSTRRLSSSGPTLPAR
jgi:O-antigen ligase